MHMENLRESWKSKLARLAFNIFPAYRRTGARVVFISHDWKRVRVKLPLNIWTRNAVGTLFGGSMFAAVDPVYMVMFMRLLGKAYVVWDKSAEIAFLKPGRTTLYAEFSIEDAELEYIRRELESAHSLDRVYRISLCDHDHVEHAVVNKTLYFRKNRER
ncbi:DUF4442 domain-containing protein [Desulfurispirillum indicum]|uniref:DUF4442 domain-containing protein n=1 Tax=Desulfurispirillum indicum TaxID=936456 RepID=UPI001CFB3BA2|nr:DUF4442 domain-containing protein [Desulfurispirillum indicum]UCZ55540.1 DUF4442 domain-containing protein [Desulfurispirillum indicum]